jgi:hypothetical protein
MMRANKRRILSWTATRGTLRHLAGLLAGLERDEASEVLATLAGEIESLQRGDATAEIWRQATADLDGPQSYGLQRIGLWPEH